MRLVYGSNDTTLRDWIERAMKDGLIECFGKGRRKSPYRYALPGKKFDPLGLPPFDFVNLSIV